MCIFCSLNGVLEPDFIFGMAVFDTNLSFGPFDPDFNIHR